jgi:hypothetical protein
VNPKDETPQPPAPKSAPRRCPACQREVTVTLLTLCHPCYAAGVPAPLPDDDWG